MKQTKLKILMKSKSKLIFISNYSVVFKKKWFYESSNLFLPYGFNEPKRKLIRLVFTIYSADILYKNEKSYVDQLKSNLFSLFNSKTNDIKIYFDENQNETLNTFVRVTFNEETVIYFLLNFQYSYNFLRIKKTLEKNTSHQVISKSRMELWNRIFSLLSISDVFNKNRIMLNRFINSHRKSNC
jgi:hypothetical protein